MLRRKSFVEVLYFELIQTSDELFLKIFTLVYTGILKQLTIK